MISKLRKLTCNPSSSLLRSPIYAPLLPTMNIHCSTTASTYTRGRKIVKHWKKALALLAFIAIALMITIGLLTEPNVAPGYTPLTPEEHQALDAEDNGYHLLQEAMDGIDTSISKTLRQELEDIATDGSASASAREFITRHEESISTAHRALKLEPFIAPPYSIVLVRPYDGIRDMFRLLIYNGHLHRIDGNIDTMLESYLDALILGYSIAKNGVLIEGFLSIAFERQTVLFLYDALGLLNEQQLNTIIEALSTFQVERLPHEHIIANERAFSDRLMRQQSNPIERLLMPLTKITTNRMLDPLYDQSKHSFDEVDTLLIATTLRARVTLYELEHGESPDSLQEVMNGAAIPIDPSTGNPFKYRDGKISSLEDDTTKEIDKRTVF